LRTATRACLKSWLHVGEVMAASQRHPQAPGCSLAVFFDVASYIVHVFAIASQHCCLLLQSRFPKKQRAKVFLFFCKGLEHMNPVE